MSNAEAWFKSTAAKQRAVVKDYEAEMKWLSSSEAKQRAAAAKARALSKFKKRFPRANISRFIARVDFDTNRKATGQVLFPDGDGSWEDPLIEDRKYWSQSMRDALGMHQDGGFPAQLSPLIENKPLPVPVVDFSDNITQSVADIFNKEMKIYVTLTDYFTTKFRKIFTRPQNVAVQNSVFWPKWLYLGISCSKQCFCVKWLDFGNSYSKLCVLAKMALSWQKLLKTVVLAKIA